MSLASLWLLKDQSAQKFGSSSADPAQVCLQAALVCWQRSGPTRRAQLKALFQQWAALGPGWHELSERLSEATSGSGTTAGAAIEDQLGGLSIQEPQHRKPQVSSLSGLPEQANPAQQRSGECSLTMQ